MAVKKLTTHSIDSMKPGSELRDTVLQGFTCRSGRTGQKSFFVIIRLNPTQRKRIKIGEYPVMDVDQARARALETLSEADRWANLTDLTVRELIERYLDSQAFITLSPKWKEYVSHVIDSVILPKVGEIKAEDVTRGELVRLLDNAVSRGGTLANHTKRILSKIWNWGLDRELVSNNPAYRLPMPAETVKRDRVLTDSEIKSVWDALEEDATPLARVFQLMLATGQRSGEIKALRWEDIEGDWIILRDTKNGTTQRAYLGELGREILGKVPMQDEAWVFPARRGAKGHLKTTHVGWRRIRQSTGIDDANPHDLRRTMATSVAKAGGTMDVVGRILNHTPQGVTSLYQRYGYENEVVQVVDAWHRRLRQIVSGEQAKVLSFG